MSLPVAGSHTHHLRRAAVLLALALLVITASSAPAARARAASAPKLLTLQLVSMQCYGRTDEYVRGENDYFTIAAYSLDLANPRRFAGPSPLPRSGSLDLGECLPTGKEVPIDKPLAHFSLIGEEPFPRHFSTRVMLVEVDSGRQLAGYRSDFWSQERQAEQDLYERKQRYMSGYAAAAQRLASRSHLEWVEVALSVATGIWSLIQPLIDWFQSRDDRFPTRTISTGPVRAPTTAGSAKLPATSDTLSVEVSHGGVRVRLNYAWIIR